MAYGLLSKLLKKATHGGKAQEEHGLLGFGAHLAKIPGFKHGGKVKVTGAYKLHKGEKVLSAAQAKSHPCLDK